jgi:hypothetical protein
MEIEDDWEPNQESSLLNKVVVNFSSKTTIKEDKVIDENIEQAE